MASAIAAGVAQKVEQGSDKRREARGANGRIEQRMQERAGQAKAASAGSASN